MSRDPYDGETYGDTRGVRDEATDRGAEEAYDDTMFPSRETISPFEWSIWPGAREDDVYEDESVQGADYDGEASGDEDDGLGWDEGMIGTLLLVGLALFLIPEPTTSAIGVFLLALGAGAWVVDWLL